MLEGLIEQTVSWTMQVISNLGYFASFLTMMIESASVPLPSEIIMPFSGFLVSKGEFSFIPTVVVGAFGNLVGSILMYCLGYFGQEAVIKRFIRGWGKLLIVEDDNFVSELYDHQFSKNGFATSLAGDGEVALDLIKKEKFDVVLLDIMIPKIDGVEVLKRLKADANTKDMAVIILSNLGQDE